MGERYEPSIETLNEVNADVQSAEQLDVQNGKAQESKFRSIYESARRWTLYGITALTIYGGARKIMSAEQTAAFEAYRDEQEKNSDVPVESLKAHFEKLIGGRVGEVEAGAKDAFFENENMEPRKPPIIRIFGPDISDSTANVLLEDGRFLPKNYVNGEVSEIRFDVPRRKMEKFGMQESSAGMSDTKKSVIEISIPGTILNQTATNRDHIEAMLPTVFHEIGHLNDWSTDRDLDYVERYQLLNKVITRMHSEDRVKGIVEEFVEEEDGTNVESYTDKIKISDSGEDNYATAKEYWAMLVENYLANPDWLLEIHPADFALVDTYVKKNDPTFDPIVARKKLKQYLEVTIGPDEYGRGKIPSK